MDPRLHGGTRVNPRIRGGTRLRGGMNFSCDSPVILIQKHMDPCLRGGTRMNPRLRAGERKSAYVQYGWYPIL